MLTLNEKKIIKKDILFAISPQYRLDSCSTVKENNMANDGTTEI